jgi:hypothetical protein
MVLSQFVLTGGCPPHFCIPGPKPPFKEVWFNASYRHLIVHISSMTQHEIQRTSMYYAKTMILVESCVDHTCMCRTYITFEGQTHIQVELIVSQGETWSICSTKPLHRVLKSPRGVYGIPSVSKYKMF